MNPASTFAKTASRAMQLPVPAAIARLILASTEAAHNGLRAATYEARTSGTGHDVHLTHPEVGAERRIERGDKDSRRPLDDLRDLSKASERFVDAIAALNAECLDAPPPETWDEAVKDADHLAEHDLIEAALDVGRDVTGWVKQANTATIDIGHVWKRYAPRASTPWERYKRAGGRADEVCDIHVSLKPPMFKRKHGREQLCKTCADLKRTAGQRPPVDLIHTLEHGTQLEYRKARSRWFQDLGLRQESQGA